MNKEKQTELEKQNEDASNDVTVKIENKVTTIYDPDGTKKEDNNSKDELDDKLENNSQSNILETVRSDIETNVKDILDSVPSVDIPDMLFRMENNYPQSIHVSM